MSDEKLTRPIIGIENRTALEVFDIMCDRIRRLSPKGHSEASVDELCARLRRRVNYSGSGTGIDEPWPANPDGPEAADALEAQALQIAGLKIDCEFLLSVIDSCDEAEAPSGEMEPADVANIARIRTALSNSVSGVKL
jgi:hypothetical protein